MNHTGTTVNPYQYTGQQFDSLTGLYDLRARYYNPALGRFLSQDTYPVNFGNPVELNRYVYAGNTPINRMDPSGQDFIDFDIQLGTVAKYIPLIIVVGLATYAVISALHQLVGTQERTWTWERILALEESESNIAPRGNPNTNTTPEVPRIPWRPTIPAPTETPRPKKIVVELGSGDFANLPIIKALHSDARIIGIEHPDTLAVLNAARQSPGISKEFDSMLLNYNTCAGYLVIRLEIPRFLG